MGYIEPYDLLIKWLTKPYDLSTAAHLWGDEWGPKIGTSKRGKVTIYIDLPSVTRAYIF